MSSTIKIALIIILTLLLARELFVIFPDYMAVKVRDVKLLDVVCVENEDDGYFYPHVKYEGGEELLSKQGFRNPARCEEKYHALIDKSLPVYKRAVFGSETLDPSVSYRNYTHLFLLIIAGLYVYMFKKPQ